MPPAHHPSRRDVLRWIGAGSALAATGALAACAPPASSSVAPDSTGGGGGGDLGSTMTLATWPNYDDPAMIQKFTDETGVTVNVQVYGSTEEMEALLRAGNSGIDVAVPSQYAIPGWIQDKLIEPLEVAAMGSPDFTTWNPMVTNQAFDPGNKYTFPKLWGTTGMLFTPDIDAEPTTWEQYFDIGSNLDRRCQIVDHQISSLGSTAVALGYSFNTRDPKELGEIEKYLKSIKPKLYAISSDIQPGLRNGDSWMSIAWTGDGIQVIRDKPEMKYQIGTDGGEIWTDSYSVPADAPHKAAAYAFLKFFLTPENAAKNHDFILFPSADPAVTALISDEVRNNPTVYPSDEAIKPLSFAEAETYNSPLRAETWSRIKSS